MGACRLLSKVRGQVRLVPDLRGGGERPGTSSPEPVGVRLQEPVSVLELPRTDWPGVARPSALRTVGRCLQPPTEAASPHGHREHRPPPPAEGGPVSASDPPKLMWGPATALQPGTGPPPRAVTLRTSSTRTGLRKQPGQAGVLLRPALNEPAGSAVQTARHMHVTAWAQPDGTEHGRPWWAAPPRSVLGLGHQLRDNSSSPLL